MVDRATWYRPPMKQSHAGGRHSIHGIIAEPSDYWWVVCTLSMCVPTLEKNRCECCPVVRGKNAACPWKLIASQFILNLCMCRSSISALSIFLLHIMTVQSWSQFHWFLDFGVPNSASLPAKEPPSKLRWHSFLHLVLQLRENRHDAGTMCWIIDSVCP